jgi:hypothetical protein
MVFHPRSGYNYTPVLYTKITSLLSNLITNRGASVFEKLPDVKEHFQVHKALSNVEATLLDKGMNTIYKALFLENFITY